MDISEATAIWSNIATIAATLTSCVSLWLALFVLHESKRPQIAVYLKHDAAKNCIYFVVQNIGNGFAYKVKFSDYDNEILKMSFPDHTAAFLSHGIEVLPPSGVSETIIACGCNDLMKTKNFKSSIHVAYEESGIFGQRKANGRHFLLDCTSFVNVIYA